MKKIWQKQYEEVSTRVHYLIRKGKIPLPARERIVILKKKNEMKAILHLLLAAYISLISARCIYEAAMVLECFRGLGEIAFEDIFAEFGYPDERSIDPQIESWLGLAKACELKYGCSETGKARERLTKANPEEVRAWQESLGWLN